MRKYADLVSGNLGSENVVVRRCVATPVIVVAFPVNSEGARLVLSRPGKGLSAKLIFKPETSSRITMIIEDPDAFPAASIVPGRYAPIGTLRKSNERSG